MSNPPQAEIAKLLEIEEIRRLKARYFRAVDTKDVAAFRDLFTEDATFEAVGRVRRGRDEIVGLSSLLQEDIRSVHHGHSPEIEILGPEAAHGVWAMHDYLVITLPDGATCSVRGYGHYHEDYVKRGGRWFIDRLMLTRLRVDYSDEPAHDGTLAEQEFLRRFSRPG